MIDEQEFCQALTQGTITPGRPSKLQLSPGGQHQQLSSAGQIQLAEETAAQHFRLAQQKAEELENLGLDVKEELLRVEAEAEEEATRVR